MSREGIVLAHIRLEKMLKDILILAFKAFRLPKKLFTTSLLRVTI
jgi:hypothetical protein